MTNKHFEIKSYEYLGISVIVQIDYDNRRISLVEQYKDFSDDVTETIQTGYKVKEWVFAHRTLDYVKSWQNILLAMQYAIGEAIKEIEKDQQLTEKNTKERMNKIVREIGEHAEKKMVEETLDILGEKKLPAKIKFSRFGDLQTIKRKRYPPFKAQK